MALFIGKYEVGVRPLVVGTLSSRDFLPSAGHAINYSCDVVELRLDMLGVGVADWLPDARAIEAAGWPVLATLRLAVEGGTWIKPDLKRMPTLLAALDAVSCVDVEFASECGPELCARAEALGKPLVVSHHNFTLTPPLGELEATLRGIRLSRAAIPKITTYCRTAEDVAVLQTLLTHHGGRSSCDAGGQGESQDKRARRSLPLQEGPLCIMGMGALGTETRVRFPVLGSCLTYGYLDTPSAPGQLAAAELKIRLGP